MGNILVGLYGHECDEKAAELEDLVRAARRDAAETLRDAAMALNGQCGDNGTDSVIALGIGRAAYLIFPEYPKEGDE
ncbi:hypothetical protein [Streptomyces sp. NPDC092295]|uniref:hypothetical protein n=1 Tax=Streptomyces sp. NPDC092295 TaxID=3366011 RepID=UPI00380CC926